MSMMSKYLKGQIKLERLDDEENIKKDFIDKAVKVKFECEEGDVMEEFISEAKVNYEYQDVGIKEEYIFENDSKYECANVNVTEEFISENEMENECKGIDVTEEYISENTVKYECEEVAGNFFFINEVKSKYVLEELISEKECSTNNCKDNNVENKEFEETEQDVDIIIDSNLDVEETDEDTHFIWNAITNTFEDDLPKKKLASNSIARSNELNLGEACFSNAIPSYSECNETYHRNNIVYNSVENPVIDIRNKNGVECNSIQKNIPTSQGLCEASSSKRTNSGTGHTNKLYKCFYCYFVSKNKSHVQTHIRIHVGEKYSMGSNLKQVITYKQEKSSTSGVLTASNDIALRRRIIYTLDQPNQSNGHSYSSIELPHSSRTNEQLPISDCSDFDIENPNKKRRPRGKSAVAIFQDFVSLTIEMTCGIYLNASLRDTKTPQLEGTPPVQRLQKR